MIRDYPNNENVRQKEAAVQGDDHGEGEHDYSHVRNHHPIARLSLLQQEHTVCDRVRNQCKRDLVDVAVDHDRHAYL